MAITAVAFQSMVEVTISSGPSFQDDLARFKGEIKPQDRKWDDLRLRWKVSNPKNYQHVDFIKAALEERERQPELF